MSLEGWIERSHVKFLIGKSGKNFKEITKDSNISFMWYNERDHSVQLWGHTEGNIKATALINKKLNEIEYIKYENTDKKRQRV